LDQGRPGRIGPTFGESFEGEGYGDDEANEAIRLSGCHLMPEVEWEAVGERRVSSLYVRWEIGKLIRMFRIVLKCLMAAAVVVSMSGCLTQRTVTEGGRKVSQEYVIKRPLKEAVQNSR
jgi:hypothetical protein